MQRVRHMTQFVNSARTQCVILVIATFAEMILNFGRTPLDSSHYLRLAITGSSPIHGVMVRFMLSYLASGMLKLIGSSLSVSALVVTISLINCLFWAGGVVVSYRLGVILGDRMTGFMTALFFTTSIPILFYGAAVLTDMPGYFFVGLALLIILSKSEVSPHRAALEGVGFAVGGFFHPTAFLGLLLIILRRLLKGSALVTLAGSTLVLAPVGRIALNGGWFKSGLPFIGNIFRSYNLLQGPRLDQALMYTFGILGLGYLELRLETYFPGPGIPALAFALFALVAILGIHAIAGKHVILLLGYLLAMTVPTILGRVFIEILV